MNMRRLSRAAACFAVSAVSLCVAQDERIPMPGGCGLGFCVSATNNPAPALRLALRYNLAPNDWSVFGACRELSLGEIRLPGVKNAAISIAKADNVSFTYLLGGRDADSAGESVSVSVSRLTPAVLLELDGYSLALFAGDKSGWAQTDPRWVKLWAERHKVALGEPRAPRRFAMSDSKSVRVGALAGDEQDFDGFEHGWLLLWYGADAWFFGGTSTLEAFTTDVNLFAGDAPILVLCSQPPFVSLTGPPDNPGEGPGGSGPEGSLVMTFAEPGAKIALLPLEGYRFPAASETAAWSAPAALPQAIEERCDWWAERLAEYPRAVNETIAYNSADDTAEWQASFAYITIRPGGMRCAPLPPMLELARQAGFPVTLPGAPVESGTPLYCGPYSALENTNGYVVRVRGLGRYALESQATAQPAGGVAADALRAELAGEIDKMLEAGHLAPLNLPFKMAPGWGGYVTGRQLYFAPGKTLSTLASALPFLDAARQAKLREYLVAERNAFPPETVWHLPAETGARREAWMIPEHYLTNTIARSAESAFQSRNKLMPSEALYDLAAYYGAVGADRVGGEGFSPEDAAGISVRPWIEREDWAALGWFAWPMDRRDPHWFGSYGWSQVSDANRMANAFIGLARLARLTGDKPLEDKAMARLARALTHRFAIGKYAAWLYRQGGILKAPAGFDPARDPREVAVNEQTSVMGYAIRWDDPFLPRFNDVEGPYTEMTPELARFFADFLKPEAAVFAELTAKYCPDAFMTLGTPRRCQEWWHNYPQDNLQIFMTHARILGRDFEWLRRRLDVPLAPVGDLYYIDKLVALLGAYGAQAWLPFAENPR